MPRPSTFWQRLAGKTAIVTGAGSQGTGVGIGKAISFVFASEGAQVCLVDRETTRAEETRAMIAEAGGEAFVCTADVTDTADCARIVSETLKRYGKLDILVNNVGIATAGGRLEQLDEATWHRVLDVNLKSAFLMAKHAASSLIASGRGAIVNITSIAGLQGHGAAVYGPSKAAVIALTRELAVIYGRDGVRANAIAPGHMFTPLSDGIFDEAARRRRRDVAPLGIEGDAWDIAAAALFLASDEARFITGACLPVDGGVTEVGALRASEFLKG